MQRCRRDFQEAQPRDARHEAPEADRAQALAEEEARQQRHRQGLRVDDDAAEARRGPPQTLRQEALQHAKC